MNHFWEATYSGVTWLQLFGGYIVAAFLGMIVVIYYWLLRLLIDKTKSLEAEIGRLISRPRLKKGRLAGKGKG